MWKDVLATKCNSAFNEHRELLVGKKKSAKQKILMSEKNESDSYSYLVFIYTSGYLRVPSSPQWDVQARMGNHFFNNYKITFKSCIFLKLKCRPII